MNHIYIINNKLCGDYSHEKHIIVASGLKNLKKVMIEKNIIQKEKDFKNWDVVEFKTDNPGLIYSDIY